MKNLEIAKIFYEMADILELEEVQWKPRAFREAAKSLETLSEDIEDVAKRGALREIPGVGEKISDKINEYIKTGKIKEHESLKKKIHFNLTELMSVPGLGAKRAKVLYEKLGIKNLKDLQKAIDNHKIAKLGGFGAESELNLAKGLKLEESNKGRMLLSNALFTAENIVSKLKALKEVDKISIAGSLRRMKETIGDIDICVTSKNHAKVISFFTNMQDVKQVLAKGDTKATIITKSNIQVDVRVLEPDQWGAALLYFTGSKEHNIELRRIAIKKGLKLNEYGLFKGNKSIAGKTEEEMYKALGMKYIEPELRENRGEIEAAIKNKLPELIGYNDLKGDFHIHTEWSDGSESIKDMAEAAKKLGYEYICITDHSKSEPVAHGMNEQRILKYLKEIEKVRKQVPGIKILAGCEVDILSDGTLDFSDNILKKLDIVLASVHSGFRMTKEQMTKRVLKALKNQYVNIFGHPTERLLNERPGYEIDLKEIFKTGKIMEIDSYPSRLDLNDGNIIEAKKAGARFTIDSDGHSIEELKMQRFGIAMARRGWLCKKDVVNTCSFKELKKVFPSIKVD